VDRSPPVLALGYCVGAGLHEEEPGEIHLTVHRRLVQQSPPVPVLGCRVAAVLLREGLGEIHMTTERRQAQRTRPTVVPGYRIGPALYESWGDPRDHTTPSAVEPARSTRRCTTSICPSLEPRCRGLTRRQSSDNLHHAGTQ
jgi:hypothetical protein